MIINFKSSVSSLEAVPANSIPEKILKDKLSISKKSYSKYGYRMGEPTKYWRSKNNTIFLPRNFLELEGIAVADRTDEKERGEDFEGSISFSKGLRDYQKKFIDENPELYEDRDTIIEAGCGSGKTVMSLYLIWSFGKKAVVLVPTNFLATQYRKRAEEFLDGAKIYQASPKMKGGEWRGNDIVIISYELFKVRSFDSEFYRTFGHFVIDEGHRIGSDQYENIIPRFHCSKRTMLTATFRREDGSHEILKYHFGELIKMPPVNPRVNVYVLKTNLEYGCLISLKKIKAESIKAQLSLAEKMSGEISYIFRDGILELDYEEIKSLNARSFAFKLNKSEAKILQSWMKKCTSWEKSPQYSTLDSFISTDSVRNSKVIVTILSLVREGRKVLVLGKRKDQLKKLDSRLSKVGIKTLLVTGDTIKELQENDTMDKEAGKSDVVIGIDKLAKEGMDVDALDTLLLIHPIGDTEQALGRVARIKEGKNQPEAFYMLDNSMAYLNLFRKSKKFISRNGELINQLTLSDLK